MKKYETVIYIFIFIVLVSAIFWHKEKVAIIGPYLSMLIDVIAIILLLIMTFTRKK
jgi:hypothetical protein